MTHEQYSNTPESPKTNESHQENTFDNQLDIHAQASNDRLQQLNKSIESLPTDINQEIPEGLLTKITTSLEKQKLLKAATVAVGLCIGGLQPQLAKAIDHVNPAQSLRHTVDNANLGSIHIDNEAYISQPHTINGNLNQEHPLRHTVDNEDIESNHGKPIHINKAQLRKLQSRLNYAQSPTIQTRTQHVTYPSHVHIGKNATVGSITADSSSEVHVGTVTIDGVEQRY